MIDYAGPVQHCLYYCVASVLSFSSLTHSHQSIHTMQLELSNCPMSRWILRALVFASVAVAISLPGVVLRPAFAQQPDGKYSVVHGKFAWRKSSAAEPSYFVPHGGKRWLEIQEKGNRFSFVETKASENAVELLDAGRGIRIRLQPKRAELAQGDQGFRPWEQGDWVMIDQLPEYAQVAPVDYKARLIYFVPSDRKPTAAFEAKIRCVMSFVNSAYRYELRRRDLPGQGLSFQTDDSNQPIVHLVHGSHEAAFYTGSPNYDTQRQYQRLVPEIPKSIGHPTTHLIVAFMETYDDGPWEYEWPGGVALGGRWSSDGGLGIFSSWILQDLFCATTVEKQVELFNDATPIVGRKAMGHGRMDSPRFEFIEDGFGAVIHEVGHALGLPHDQREDQYYIMGNGFRQLRANLNKETRVEERSRFSDENARILAVSRHLNPNVDLTDVQPPAATLRIRAAESGNPFSIQLEAQDDRGLTAVLYFDEVRGTVVGGKSLDGQQASDQQAIDLRRDPSTKLARLQAIITDTGGNIRIVSVSED
jgi:hypothetical protein